MHRFLIYNPLLCLPVSLYFRKFRPGIRFVIHLMDDFNTVVSSHYTTGNKGKVGGMVCPVSKNVLLYEDLIHTPSCMRWLDCSKKEPTPDSERETIHSLRGIIDVCCIQNDRSKLLITATAVSLNAHNLRTGKSEWMLSGKVGKMALTMIPKSVCTDKQGKLYVLDGNNHCILIISSDGKYEDSFMCEDDTFSRADRIRWGNRNQLIVHHIDSKGKHFLSIWRVKDGA